MTLLNLKDLGITLGGPLFSNLNLSINRGDRIGLVAANGRGKSSLLRCIAGDLAPGSGAITRARGLRIGHVTQDIADDLAQYSLYETVRTALPEDQWDYESWRVDVVLDGLQVPGDLRDVALQKLSGGWQRVAMLARAWVTEPDLLLLDEPTNHLDLGRIGILQRWLCNQARDVPLLLASHDRAFLDAVTNRTLFLRPEKSPIFALPYSAARAGLEQVDASDARRFDNDMKQAGQLRRQASKLRNIGINSGSDLLLVKTKQLQERADNLETAARPAHREMSAGKIQLGNSGTHARALVSFDDCAVCTPDGRLLFRTAQRWINRGDRVVLLGGNGAGKTQLVRLFHRAISADEPGISITPSVVLGYSDQSLSQFDQDQSPHHAITRRFDISDPKCRSLLAGAGIGVDLQKAAIGALSGGQKARLAMLVLRLTGPNMYLLDEPTNHLDIDGQEALETQLLAHGASCLLVSHDRQFIREVGTRFWQIIDQKLVELDGPEDFFDAAIRAD